MIIKILSFRIYPILVGTWHWTARAGWPAGSGDIFTSGLVVVAVVTTVYNIMDIDDTCLLYALGDFGVKLSL